MGLTLSLISKRRAKNTQNMFELGAFRFILQPLSIKKHRQVIQLATCNLIIDTNVKLYPLLSTGRGNWEVNLEW